MISYDVADGYKRIGETCRPVSWENLYHSKHFKPYSSVGRGQLKCDGTRAETRFRLSTKRTNPFKSAGASFQSTAGSRGVHISGSNTRYTKFRSGEKGTGYPLHSPVSPSLPLPCVTVCHHILTGVYLHDNMLFLKHVTWTRLLERLPVTRQSGNFS